MFKIVGCIDNEWSDVFDSGFKSYDEALTELKEIRAGHRAVDPDWLEKASLWIEEDDEYGKF